MKRTLLLLFVCLANVTFALAKVTATNNYNGEYTIAVGAAGELASYTPVADADADATTIVVTGELNDADLAALTNFTKATSINLDGATLATGASVTNIKSNSVLYMALPSGITTVNSSTISSTPCPNLASVISISTDGSGKAVYGYVKTAGTLLNSMKLIVTKIGTGTEYYYSATNVTSVTLSGNLNNYDFANANIDGIDTNIPALRGANLITADLSGAIFADVEHMAFNAYGNTLTTVKLPTATTMTEIPTKCFYQCYHINNIYIPSTYTNIEDYAFYNCTDLTHIYTDGASNTSQNDHGANTATFSANITHIGTYAFALDDKFKDIYVLATTAPTCELNAFDAGSYYGYGGFTGTYPITRDSYVNSTHYFSMLHFPNGLEESEIKKYSDPDRKYTVVDEMQNTDGDGNILIWPNLQEFYKAESQAMNGQTWKAWASNEYGGGVVFDSPTKKNDKQQTISDVTSDHTQTFSTDYAGWHQFVLSAAYDYTDPDDPHWNFNKITDNNWWTICVPFDMTKSQLYNLFGNSSTSEYPVVCTLSKVIRDADKEIVKLCFGEDLVASATSEDATVIKAGYPYMIKPIMAEVKGTTTWTPAKHIFTYTKVTSTEGLLLPHMPAEDDIKSTVKDDGTTAAGDGFDYRFISAYINTAMPAYAFYLGWDATAKQAAFYYQGSDASTNKYWNAYTCIVGAKMSVTEVAAKGSIANSDYVQKHYSVTCAEDLFHKSNAKVAIIMANGETPTAINGVTIDNEAAKEITGNIYNLNGQQVKTSGTLEGLSKGIYIMNGKKYVVK